MNFQSVDEALDFAIKNEEEAATFYTELAGRVTAPNVKEIFLGFAEEEKGHKAKLEAVKNGARLLAARSKVLDLKIGDYMAGAEPHDNMSYADSLVVAMQAEKAAFKLYTDLAASTADATLRELFLGLAQEEAKHKLRFELEYDEEVMREN